MNLYTINSYLIKQKEAYIKLNLTKNNRYINKVLNKDKNL